MLANCLSLFVLLAAITASQSKSNSRIVGGYPVEIGHKPFIVSLRRSWNDNHFCGGSLISPRLVVTAAHCCHYTWGGILPPSTVKVVAGQVELNITDSSVVINAERIIIHEAYDSETMDNDIAIIVLESQIPLDNPYISLVALNDLELADETLSEVSGWGALTHEVQVPSEKLMEAQLRILNKEDCQRKYSKVDIDLTPSMMCAAVPDGSKDACQGDSGGPLYCNGRLCGIVSTGIDCAKPEYPGIYTNVKYMMPWIYPFFKQYQ